MPLAAIIRRRATKTQAARRVGGLCSRSAVADAAQTPTLTISDSWDVHVPGIEERGSYENTRQTTDEHAQALREIEKLARRASAQVEKRRLSHKLSAEHFDMGITTVYSEVVAIAAPSAAALATLLRAAKPYVLAYLTRSASHSVSVKYDDVEVSIKGTNDVEKAIRLLEAAEAAKRQRKSEEAG
jgi:hypothetical protein